MSDGNTVSFIIRTYNEAAFIGRLLKTLQEQKDVTVEREIVIVDSGSTDDTVRIAQQWPIRLVRMRKEEFDYSRALNLGIEQSRGKLVVILSAHSIPSDTSWLARMIAHFDDATVAGVYSRQIPWPDANWRERRRIAATFGTQNLVYNGTCNPDDLTFSNAASCIRRSVWEARPFVLPIAEDVAWAKWAINNRHKIVYEAGVSVYHSHNDNCRQNARRAVEFEKGLDLSTGRDRTSLLTLRQALGCAYRDLRYVLTLHDPKTNRFRLAWDCLANAYWFLKEFNR